MLDAKMMMQSKPQTRGSMLRNGNRHDAVVREIPSATAVLFRDEFGMTLPLRYATLTCWRDFSRQVPSPIAQSDKPLRLKAHAIPLDEAYIASIGPKKSRRLSSVAAEPSKSGLARCC
jgi:hypothetical protein